MTTRNTPVVKEKSVEHLENAAVKLTVTIGQEAIREQYDDLLKTYSKSAQIKGFRKGHVPANVLERKFGDSMKFETSQKVLEESLKEVFDEIEEKPLPYSQPSLEGELDFDLEKDFTYAVKYDVYPEVKLGEYKGLEIEVPQVSVTKDDEERELKALQDQNAVVMEKDEGFVEAGDVVTVDYSEMDDEGNEMPDTRREDFVFTQGSGYNLYKIDDEVLGMKSGEEKVADKEFPEDFENKDLAGTTKKLKIVVKAIKQRQLPELDDELAQDISDKYKTLADLKTDIRKRLDDTVDGRLREHKVNAIVEKVVADSEVPVPESMVAAELESAWQNFVGQFGGHEEQVLAMLKMQERTREDVYADWRPGAVTRIQGQLAVHKLVELEKIEVSDEEIEADLEKQASSGSVTKEQAREYYERNDMMDYLRREIRERKLFDSLLEASKMKKGKKLSFLDLLQRNK
jgi:trigger factor